VSLDALRLQLTRKITSTARGFADEWERELRSTGPTASGRMRDRTTTRVSARAGAIVIEAKVDTPYAHIVRSGQRPHEIRARNPGGVLVFQSRGRTVFARSVNHPGAQPNSWWDDSLRDVPNTLARIWRGSR